MTHPSHHVSMAWLELAALPAAALGAGQLAAFGMLTITLSSMLMAELGKIAGRLAAVTHPTLGMRVAAGPDRPSQAHHLLLQASQGRGQLCLDSHASRHREFFFCHCRSDSMLLSMFGCHSDFLSTLQKRNLWF